MHGRQPAEGCVLYAGLVRLTFGGEPVRVVGPPACHRQYTE